MRRLILIGSLLLALALAALALQTPAPLPASAPEGTFSAGRAMADVEAIAQRPHPIGSPEHARVQAYLLKRLAELGLQVSTQTGPISEAAADYLRDMGGDPAAANFSAVNLIGVAPGRDPSLPALALMAHYDTVPMSPGAADDSTGVAAILETVRALRARGAYARTLVVLLTDSEELGLDGARNFWSGHPLREEIGAVVNLEARGGGGRAMMFETGPGNAETVAAFGAIAGKVRGGVTSNSLAVFVYELMPNGTDFTHPRRNGVQGINLAFLGRPAQYHTAMSTPASLDRGSLQHIGEQTLAYADAMLRAETLPQSTADAVYSDVLGAVVLAHTPQAGWAIFAAALLIFIALAVRARAGKATTFADMGAGLIDGVWFVTAGVAFAQSVRALAGPMSTRAESADVYYMLLSRLPYIEAAAGLAILAAALMAIGGRRPGPRWATALAVALTAGVGTVLAGPSAAILAPAALAIALSFAPTAKTAWGGALGLLALVLGLAAGAQILAPETAFLFLWIGLLGALAAAAAALTDLSLRSLLALAGPAAATALGGAWLMAAAHPMFLGIGIDLPGALAVLGLLLVALLRLLAPRDPAPALTIGAASALVAAALVAVAAQF